MTLTGDDNSAANSDLFILKGQRVIYQILVSTITDFQVGLDTARLFLNNSDVVTEDTTYSSGTKIGVSSSSSFDWLTKNQFSYDLSSFDFVSSLK